MSLCNGNLFRLIPLQLYLLFLFDSLHLVESEVTYVEAGSRNFITESSNLAQYESRCDFTPFMQTITTRNECEIAGRFLIANDIVPRWKTRADSDPDFDLDYKFWQLKPEELVSPIKPVPDTIILPPVARSADAVSYQTAHANDAVSYQTGGSYREGNTNGPVAPGCSGNLQ